LVEVVEGDAAEIAKAVRAGAVWIDTSNMIHPASPFGGFKQSGYGRELGKHALDLYTQVKSVWVDLSERSIGWFAA
jgi:phenylacetaldehyde dehydrogenase